MPVAWFFFISTGCLCYLSQASRWEKESGTLRDRKKRLRRLSQRRRRFGHGAPSIFNEFRRICSAITQRMLRLQLRELEIPIIIKMKEWGGTYK